MSGNLGFEPTKKESGYYFVSYNFEDADRVGKICRMLRLEYPEIDIWYDKALRHDEQWSAKIAEKIDNCKEMIFFYTRGIFEKGSERFASGEYEKITDVWTFQEYKTARDYEKRILVVYLDDVDIKTVCYEMVSWYQELKPSNGMQGILAYNMGPGAVGINIFKELAGSSVPDKITKTGQSKRKSKQLKTKNNQIENNGLPKRTDGSGRKKSTAILGFISVIVILFFVGWGISKVVGGNNEERINDGLEKSADSRMVSYEDSNKHILFGTYPQSRVTDISLIAELNSKKIDWVSYKYYAGNNQYDGSMSACDIAFYADIKYKGEKYRAVRFDKYRPSLTSEKAISASDSEETKQGVNGYFVNEIYWFKYEPISWMVLDEKEGLVVSDYIIDSQPFVNVLYEGENGKYYNRSGSYSNSWGGSFLREWLNTELIENAFTSSEQNDIKDVINRNDDFDDKETTDKIYILASDDWTNTMYGFMGNPNSYDELRAAYGTDYAKSQGLNVFNTDEEKYQSYDEKSYFGIRTTGKTTRNISYVDARGCLLNYDYVNDTGCGVRPAMKINLDSKNVEKAKQ